MRPLRPLLAFAFAMPMTLSAQSVDLTLYHTDPNELPPQALELYEEAVASYDHADHPGALNQMAEAAERAPDSIEIQLLFIGLAWSHARLTNLSWDEMVDTVDRALASYQRVMNDPQLPSWALQTLDREYEHAQYIMDNAEEIYAERVEAGTEIQQYLVVRRVQLERMRTVQAAELRARREAEELRTRGTPNRLFQEAAEARRGPGRNRGVRSVRQGAGPSSGEGVYRVN